MDIKELAPKLKSSVKNGSINIQELVKLAKPLEALLTYYPNARQLTLSGVKIGYSETKKTIKISGSSPWKTGLPLEFEINLSQENSTLHTETKVGMPAEHELTIPGLTWFKLTRGTLELHTQKISAEGAAEIKVTGGLQCTMQFGSTQIPLQAEFTPEQELEFTAKLEDITLPALSDLAEFVGGKDTLNLPEQVDVLGQVVLKELKFLS